MFGSKMHFSANYGTDMMCQNNFGSRMIISLNLLRQIKLYLLTTSLYVYLTKAYPIIMMNLVDFD